MLSSFVPSQLLAGDLEEAICTHALYYSIWRRYESMPERFDWNHKAPAVHFYPLRPELVESTYLLYQVSYIIHVHVYIQLQHVHVRVRVCMHMYMPCHLMLYGMRLTYDP